MPLLLLLLLRPLLKPILYFTGFVLLTEAPGHILHALYGITPYHTAMVNQLWTSVLIILIIRHLYRKLRPRHRAPRTPPTGGFGPTGVAYAATSSARFPRAFPCPYCKSFDCNGMC